MEMRVPQSLRFLQPWPELQAYVKVTVSVCHFSVSSCRTFLTYTSDFCIQIGFAAPVTTDPAKIPQRDQLINNEEADTALWDGA